jgi:hypothetical protein
MSIVVRFKPTNLTTEKYNESIRRLEQAGSWPPDGLQSHVFFGPEDDLRVSEIWDSREQLAAFDERMMSVLTELGVGLSDEPEIFEVHNMITR